MTPDSYAGTNLTVFANQTHLFYHYDFRVKLLKTTANRVKIYRFYKNSKITDCYV